MYNGGGDPRMRGQSTGPPLRAGVRPERPSGDGGLLPMVSPPQTQSGNMTRAERFEDEKRRINESCFAKTDSAGN
ncbi:hypothetical protein LTS18_000983, partial [Coniosporium uncinatum]